MLIELDYDVRQKKVGVHPESEIFHLWDFGRLRCRNSSLAISPESNMAMLFRFCDYLGQDAPARIVNKFQLETYAIWKRDRNSGVLDFEIATSQLAVVL